MMRAASRLVLVYLASAARAIREATHEVNIPARQLELDGLLQKPLLMYFINTDASTSRRAHMEEQSKQLKLPFTRFRAVDTVDIALGSFPEYVSQGLDPSLQDNDPDRFVNATIACYVSHIHLMEQLAANYTSDRVALIFEDDILMPADLLLRVRHVLECAPPDWSLLKLSSWGATRASNFIRPVRTPWQTFRFQLHGIISMLDFEGRVALDKQCPDVYQMRRPFKEAPPALRSMIQSYPDFYYAGTGAYLVQVSKIPLILKHLRSLKISDVDHMMLLPEHSEEACTYCPYQIWPFVVQLGWRHWISSVLPPARVKERLVQTVCFLVVAMLSLTALVLFLLRGFARFVSSFVQKR
mmetsp:Transcript_53691/g.125152  ORF Transcript_53691/g.125152 Transcript_53691/m.125152 type:complete len:355 (+) Transcript_53691:53-1117(+)